MRLPKRPRLLGRASVLLARLRADRSAGLVAVAAVLLGVAVLVAATGWAASRPAPVGTVSVTTLVADVRAGEVEAAWVDDVRSRVTAQPTGGRAPVVAQVPADYLRDVVDLLVDRRVPVVTGPADATPEGLPAEAPGTSGQLPAGVQVAALLLAAGGISALLAASALAARAGRPGLPAVAGPRTGGLRGVRGRRRGVAPAEVPTTRLADVAGAEEAVAELRELVAFLDDAERFTRTGAKPPKGALLVGPPGTGKTLLARAVAGEARVPFFAVAGSDFVEQYVGIGAKRVRELFASAREHGRAIVFIDEIDAVARRRDGEGGHSETENTLIALLAEMDGFTGSGVVVLAATNRPDMLDPAITRPGRLDRRVEVPNPDRRGRERILAVHTAGKPVAADVDLVAVARRTPGFSGAQLSAVVNEACLEAVRGDLQEVTASCFDTAVATIAMGRARTSALVTEHDRRITAWHEAGHTVAALLLADADDPVSVTIVPRGPAGGVTWMSGSDDIFLPRRKAHAQLVVALAGRAAEEVLLDGEFTQGAAGDLSGATDLAQRMVRQYGMTRLGYAVRDPRSGGGDAEVTEVVEELLREAHVTATRLLADAGGLLAAVAEALLDSETLTLADVRALAAAAAVAAPASVALPPPPSRVASPRSPRAAVVPGVPLPRGGGHDADDERRGDGSRGAEPTGAGSTGAGSTGAEPRGEQPDGERRRRPGPVARRRRQPPLVAVASAARGVWRQVRDERAGEAGAGV